MEKQVIPFKTDEEEKEGSNQIEGLAYIINSVDGSDPSMSNKKIIHLYCNGDIDYETAKFAILRNYQK